MSELEFEVEAAQETPEPPRSVERNGVRRRADRMRILWEKVVAIVLAGVCTMAAHFWNESRQALQDIATHTSEIRVIQSQIRNLDGKVDQYQTMSREHRQELRQDIGRLEAKVERLLVMSKSIAAEVHNGR